MLPGGRTELQGFRGFRIFRLPGELLHLDAEGLC